MPPLDLPAYELLTTVAPLPAPAGLPDELTYRVPARLKAACKPGATVVVPIGGRESLAYVMAVSEQICPEGMMLRDVTSVAEAEPSFTPEQISFLRWMATDLVEPLSRVLTLSAPERHGQVLAPIIRMGSWPETLPPRIGMLTRRATQKLHELLASRGGEIPLADLDSFLNSPGGRQALEMARKRAWVEGANDLRAPAVRARTLKAARITEAGCALLASRDRPALGACQLWLLGELDAAGGPVLLSELERRQGGVRSAATSLATRGLVEQVSLRIQRSPGALKREAGGRPILNDRQQAALQAITQAMEDRSGRTLLLHGVTGSGKTEVYLHAIERCRALGRTAVLLVPEISLTAQVATLVRSRLGASVAIIHSMLSDGERFDEWTRLRSGGADVVVGPRSALFAPIVSPGLVILDEEHDSSYKQSLAAPRYHARRCARELIRQSGGCLVLGSATPDVETYLRAVDGPDTLLEIPNRVEDRPLPEVTLIDMRRQPAGQPTPISPPLVEALGGALGRGEQAILFLNRRGFNSFLLCRDCGSSPRCPHCEVTLTLHRQPSSYLLCHYCNYRRKADESCSHCLGTRVRTFGPGTQRLQASVQELFPHARIARLDRDVLQRKGAHLEVIESMRERRADVLVGTQMVTKGFDFPGVTVVGVIAADLALNQPDFRAGEKTFQLLTQVAGRSGRAQQPGHVFIQSFNPDHPAIRAAATHDFLGFYERELILRKELGNPPFGALAQLTTAQETAEAARDQMLVVRRQLLAASGGETLDIRGPAPLAVARVRDQWRWRLLLKAPERATLVEVLSRALPGLRRSGLAPQVDLDPVDLV